MKTIACIRVLVALMFTASSTILAQWVQTNGPYGGTINCFAVSGTNLFAGGGGVFLSTNNGTSWTAVNTGLTNTDVRSLAVSGTNLFAGGGGVFLSTNNGTSWTAVNTGLTSNPVLSLAVSATNLFAGTWGGGVFRSTNNGTSWTTVNTGLTNTYVLSLAVSGTNLFAGTWDGGVFLSTNNGTSWTGAGLGYPIYALAVSGTNLFAGTDGGGIFLSTNNGTSWTAVNSGLTNTYVRALAVSGTNLFAGTWGGGVFLSTNNGTSWTAVNTGLTNTTVWSLAVSGTNLFAGTDGGGIFLSTNNGTSWTGAGLGYPIYALAVSGTNLFAGTDGGGIFLSTNNGTSWTAVNTGLTNTYVWSLAVSGTNLFAGTYGGGVFFSTNNGTSWTAVNTGLTNFDIRSLAVSGTNLFAGTYGGGVFLSTNNGTSWTAVNTGLTNTTVWSLAVSGTNLFAGTDGGGIFLSTNNGTSWTAVNSGLTNTYVRALAVSGTNLFAGTSGGVFLSTNNGTSWTAVNSGLTNTYVRALAVSGTNLFAGTSGGVFLSTNNGTSWTAVNSGLTNIDVFSLAVSGTNLFAGTYRGGVWRRPLLEMITPSGLAFPSIQLSVASIQQGGSVSVSGSSYTANGAVRLIITGPSGFTPINSLLTATSTGNFSYTFTSNTSTPPGSYSTYAVDTVRHLSSPVKTFQVTVPPQEYTMAIFSPRAGDVGYSGQPLHFEWRDKMQLGSAYPVVGARRRYQYTIQLSSNGGSTWSDVGTTSGLATIDEVVTFNYDFLMSATGTSFLIRVIDFYRPTRVATSEQFTVQPAQATNLQVELIWDYSYPTMRNGNPVGVAADGVGRIYLKLSKRNPAIGPPFNSVALALLDGINTEARTLGKVMVASVTDSYSEEANSATSTTVTDNTPNRTEYWFWYVAPDDFVGNNPQDSSETLRKVKAQFIVTYSGGTQETIEREIFVVRPPLVMVHGLGGGPQTWDQFKHSHGASGMLRFLDDPRFLTRKALSLSRNTSFNINGLALLDLQNPNSLPVTIREFRINGYAANQVWYLSHSMGGNMIRAAIQTFPFRYFADRPDYINSRNYHKGFVNRIITLDTPHRGTELADFLSAQLQAMNRNLIFRAALTNIYALWPSSIVFDWLNPNPAHVPFTFDPTGALSDLRAVGGYQFNSTLVPSHLIAGDIVPGEQNVPGVDPRIWEILENASSYVNFLDRVFDLVFASSIDPEIKSLSGYLNQAERVIRFIEIALRVYSATGFVLDSDAIVKVNSQLAGLPRDPLINISVESPIVHTFVPSISATNNVNVADKVYSVLNTRIGSNVFGHIPASTAGPYIASSRPAISGRNVISRLNTPTLRILSPQSGSSFNVDSTINLVVQISDTARLAYTKVYFQDRAYADTSKTNLLSLRFQVDASSLDSQKVQVVALYDYIDSTVIVSDEVTLNVGSASSPLSFSVDPLVAKLQVNELTYPEFTAVYPTFISRIGKSSRNITAAVNNPSIVSFDPVFKSFKGLAQGETFAVVSYRGLSDTIYFVVEGELRAPTAPSLVSPANGSSGQPRNMRFVWNQIPNAGFYRLQVSVSDSFTTTVVDRDGIADTSFAVSLDTNRTFFWRVNASNSGGTSPWSQTWRFATTPTSVGDDQGLPRDFSLSQNYPNPFNSLTRIQFGLPRKVRVTLEVYNILGQRVATLVNDERAAGYHEVVFNSSSLASGVYFYRLQAGEFVQTKKLVLLR